MYIVVNFIEADIHVIFLTGCSQVMKFPDGGTRGVKNQLKTAEFFYKYLGTSSIYISSTSINVSLKRT